MIVLHVDMDAFYASVEERDTPSLRGKPLIIGSLPQERGVVSTCNYLARKYGVRSAMNSKEAYRLCPQAVFLHPNYEKYQKVSLQLYHIWKAYALVTERIALDEAYLDITETARNFSAAKEIAQTIQARIQEELSLSCSIGIGYSKSSAKMASEEKKPGGYFEIRNKEEYIRLLEDRDVSVLHGVGKKTASKLHQLHIQTVKELRNSEKILREHFGNQAEFLLHLANGIDKRKVIAYHKEDAKSISREITFQYDVSQFSFLQDVLLLLSIDVSWQRQERKLHAKGVSLKLIYGDYRSLTRSKIVDLADHPYRIYQEAKKLLAQVEKYPVRLLGVGVYHLSKNYERQLSLYDDDEEENSFYQQELTRELQRLSENYHIDFVHKLSQIFQAENLYKCIEYMRKKQSSQRWINPQRKEKSL